MKTSTEIKAAIEKLTVDKDFHETQIKNCATNNELEKRDLYYTQLNIIKSKIECLNWVLVYDGERVKYRTTKIMLEALQYSNNELCAEIAKSILRGDVTIEQALKYAGGFMKAVLNGNGHEAIVHGDRDNLIAILQSPDILIGNNEAEN